MRFVEVCIGAGQPYSPFKPENNERSFTPILIGLSGKKRNVQSNKTSA
jgi:tRNA dimethylallyltransferase